MEKKEHLNSNPKGVCEKLFDAMSVNPTFRSFRRISNHSQDSVPPATAPNISPATLPPSKSYNKPTYPEKPEQSKDHQHHHLGMQGNKNTVEVVPIKIDTLPPKKKVAEVVSTKVDPHPPQKKFAEDFPTKADPQPRPPPTKEKEKPVARPVSIQEKSHKTPTPTSDQGQGKPKKTALVSPMKAAVQQVKEVAEKANPLDGGKAKEKAHGKVEVLEEAVPTKGGGGMKGALYNINDRAADYIARAKYKIRTTTMVAGSGDGGRATSIK